jgi:hypothetical protein
MTGSDIDKWTRRFVAAAGATASLEQVGAHLSDLIGAAGTDALFARAAHLARAQHPALSGLPEGGPRRCADVRAAVEALDRRAGEQAAVRILAQVLALLVAFIGSPLTQQLMEHMSPLAARAPRPPLRKVTK